MNSTRFPDAATEDAHLAGIRGRVLGTVAQEPTSRFSRRAIVATMAAGGLAVALTGGTIAVIHATQEEIDHTARCYAAASRDADYTTLVDATEAAGVPAPNAIDPVAACGELWRMGLVGQEAIPSDPNAAAFPVPDLVGCMLRDGIAAVFPREGGGAEPETFCEGVGLAAWAG